MELRNLRTFQQVAERYSFTAAAVSLGYSQSTVSFQIRQLEEELDCLLFERINHTLRLTEQGRALLEYAQGTGSWEAVRTAFVDGWAREFQAAGGNP